MTNEELIASIMLMDAAQLLDHVMENPTDLTDPYYSEFRKAIYERYEQLKSQPEGSTV